VNKIAMLSVVFVAAVWGATCEASLTLKLDDVTLPSPSVTTQVSLDVFAQVSGSNPDLAAYSIGLLVPSPLTDAAASLTPAATPHAPGFSVDYFGQTPIAGGIGVFADTGSPLPLTDGQGLFRLVVTVPANVAPGAYTIQFTQVELSDTNGDPITIDSMVSGGVNIVPEAMASCMMCVPGMMLLMCRKPRWRLGMA